MLNKLENQPVITMEEAQEVVHTDKWFWYVIVDEAPRGQPSWKKKIRVLFTADTEDEIRSVPRELRFEPDFQNGGLFWGSKVNPEPGYQIGGIEVEWIHAEIRQE